MKLIIVKLIAIFLGFKIAFIILNDTPLVPDPIFITLMTILATSMGYIACRLIYSGLLSVLEDHRSIEEQDKDPIL